MDITLFFGLLGGLALFLYGMQMMSDGLENAAGDRMERILEKLTSNRFLGVAVGAVITAVIQSSSATFCAQARIASGAKEEQEACTQRVPLKIRIPTPEITPSAILSTLEATILMLFCLVYSANTSA